MLRSSKPQRRSIYVKVKQASLLFKANMVLAIESKKRKFIRILDSAFPTENGDTVKKKDDDSNNKMPPAKKVRIGIPDIGYTSVSTFAPYDRQQFLRRLESYRSIRRWDVKGEELKDINEVQWAKRGWICDEDSRNEVKCKQCGARLVVDVPDEPLYFLGETVRKSNAEGEDHASEYEMADNAKESRPQLVEKYKQLIIEGHEETCPWRAQGCDAAIQRLPFGNREKSIQALRERYFSMLDMAENLPEAQAILHPSELDLEAILKVLPKEFFDSSVSETDFTKILRAGDRSKDNTHDTANKEALILSIYGWEAMAEDSRGLAICVACFRRIGFWLCREPDQLNPSEMHAYYCPWINATTQTGSTTTTPKGEHLSGVESLQISLKDRQLRQHTILDASSPVMSSTTLASFPEPVVSVMTLKDLAQFGIVVPEQQTHEGEDIATKEYTAKYEARKRLVGTQLKEFEDRYAVVDTDEDEFLNKEELLHELQLKKAEQLLLEAGIKLNDIDDYIRKLRRRFAAVERMHEKQILAERQASDKDLMSRLRRIREKFNVKGKKGKVAGN